MLTAKGQEDDIVRGLELGADDYVTKPFSIRELLARVKAFLRRQGPESAGYEFGDCRLDLTAHKLFKKGVEIELTAKEFRLLEFFVKRAGPGADAGQHPGGRLGRRGDCDRPQRGPLRHHPARQDRAGPAQPAVHPYHPGHRVSV